MLDRVKRPKPKSPRTEPIRRKPKSERKEATILVRLTDGQKATLTRAAKKTGLGLSGWLLSMALREASTLEAAP